MAAKKLKITYQDGRPEEVVKVFPRAKAVTEAHLKGFTLENIYHATYYLAWSALNTLRKTNLDYETWIDQIEDVEDYEDPEEPEEAIEEVPPTLPVQSGDDSSA